MQPAEQKENGFVSRPRSRLLVASLAAMVAFIGPLGATWAAASAASVSDTFEAVGPFATTMVTVTEGTATYDVFRPANYQLLGFKSPIVTWGNGSGAAPTNYTTLLSHFASYGFTVIATTLPNTGSGREVDAAAHYLVRANSTAGNVFAHHLDVHAIAAVGHSQGATGAVRTANMDPHLITSVMTFSLPNLEWSAANPDCPVKTDCEYQLSRVSQPVFLIATHGPVDAVITDPANEESDFQSIRGRAAVGLISRSEDHRADHASVEDDVFGGNPSGELGYATAWLEYTLRANKKAAAAFSGSHPELASDSNWPGSMVKQ
jgi:pimeloyl-ACP methyl ester carboxylesterase